MSESHVFPFQMSCGTSAEITLTRRADGSLSIECAALHQSYSLPADTNGRLRITATVPAGAPVGGFPGSGGIADLPLPGGQDSGISTEEMRFRGGGFFRP